MKNAKNAKMPVQGKGVVRNANRSNVEGGVEVAGFWDTLKKVGGGALQGALGAI